MKKTKWKPKRHSLPIGVQDYEVHFTNKGLTIDQLAICDFGQRSITVSNGMSPAAMYWSEWHEAMHAIYREFGYDADGDNEGKVESVSLAVGRVAPVIVRNHLKWRKK